MKLQENDKNNDNQNNDNQLNINDRHSHDVENITLKSLSHGEYEHTGKVIDYIEPDEVRMTSCRRRRNSKYANVSNEYIFNCHHSINHPKCKIIGKIKKCYDTDFEPEEPFPNNQNKYIKIKTKNKSKLKDNKVKNNKNVTIKNNNHLYAKGSCNIYQAVDKHMIDVMPTNALELNTQNQSIPLGNISEENAYSNNTYDSSNMNPEILVNNSSLNQSIVEIAVFNHSSQQSSDLNNNTLINGVSDSSNQNHSNRSEIHRDYDSNHNNLTLADSQNGQRPPPSHTQTPLTLTHEPKDRDRDRDKFLELSTACLESLRFVDFQSKMLSGRQHDSERAAGGPQQDSVVKALVHKITSLELNVAMLEKYSMQVGQIFVFT